MKMKFDAIGKKLYSACSKAKFKVNTHAPEILVVTGVVGAVSGLVLACKATLKAEAIVKEAKEDLSTIEEASKVAKDNPELYSEEDRKKETAIVYLRTGAKLLKVYAPAIVTETVSILSVLKGHDILKKRNGALAAAYAALDKGYNEYRKRVAETIGEDKEDLLRRGLKAAKIDIPAKDESGKDLPDKKETKEVLRPEKKPVSEYARLFDEVNSTQWDKHAGYNLSFLKSTQKHANDILKARGAGGVLFLNEVYDWLGFKRSKAGQVVGWVYKPDSTDVHNFVDFGIYDTDNERVNAFLYGEEPSIWLDFNVDGVVNNFLDD